MQMGGSTSYLLHSDALGSTTMETDQAGSVNMDALFYPWGQWFQWTGPGFWASFAGLGLTNVGDVYPAQHRNYQATLGRWMTPDPGGRKVVKLDNPQTWNMYAYVTDNPTTLNDPSGLDPCTGRAAAICTELAHSKAADALAQQQTLSNAQNAAMKNPKFAPGYGGHTHCNQGACSIARAMHAPMGPLTNANGTPLGADQVRVNLAKPGSGYHMVSPANATQLAPHGVLVFVTGPGHVATVAADQNQKLPGRGPIISNVGYRNGDMRLDYVFPKSDMPEVRFYTPNQ